MKLTVETAVTQLTQLIRSTFPEENITFDLTMNVENHTRGEVVSLSANSFGFNIEHKEMELAEVQSFEYIKPNLLRGIASRIDFTVKPDLETNKIVFIENANVFITPNGYATGLVVGDHVCQVDINGKLFDIEISVFEPTEELYQAHIED